MSTYIYETLTPAQKAKHTRLYNQLDNERHLSTRLLYEAYVDKMKELEEQNKAEFEAIEEEYRVIKEEHEAIIRKAYDDMQEKRKAIRTAEREITKPLYETYNQAWDKARERFNTEWKQAEAELLASMGVEVKA